MLVLDARLKYTSFRVRLVASLLIGRNRFLIITASALGVILSIYLVLTVYGDCTGASVMCRKVHNSSYAYLLGIPVAWMGVLGYLALGITAVRRMTIYTKMLAVLGFLFELRLVYAQAIVIGVFCAWCMTSAFLMTSILWMAFHKAGKSQHAIRGGINEINCLYKKGPFHA